MSDLINEWSPVALALVAFAKEEMGGVTPEAVLAGGAVVQGVSMVAGTRLLLFGSGNGNGIWELYTSGGGLDLRRTTDATNSGDFVAGKQVRILSGDYAGRVFFYRSIPYIFEPGAPVVLPGASFEQASNAAPVGSAFAAPFSESAPDAGAVAVIPPKNNFASGISPAAFGDSFSNSRPAVVSFGLLYPLTVGGALITIGDEPLKIRS